MSVTVHAYDPTHSNTTTLCTNTAHPTMLTKSPIHSEKLISLSSTCQRNATTTQQSTTMTNCTYIPAEYKSASSTPIPSSSANPTAPHSSYTSKRLSSSSHKSLTTPYHTTSDVHKTSASKSDLTPTRPPPWANKPLPPTPPEIEAAKTQNSVETLKGEGKMRVSKFREENVDGENEVWEEDMDVKPCDIVQKLGVSMNDDVQKDNSKVKGKWAKAVKGLGLGKRGSGS